jgi:hypothetical protein
VGRIILQLQYQLIEKVNIICRKLNTPAAPVDHINIDENFIHPVLPFETVAELTDFNHELECKNYADQIVSVPISCSRIHFLMFFLSFSSCDVSTTQLY